MWLIKNCCTKYHEYYSHWLQYHLHFTCATNVCLLHQLRFCRDLTFTQVCSLLFYVEWRKSASSTKHATSHKCIAIIAPLKPRQLFTQQCCILLLPVRSEWLAEFENSQPHRAHYPEELGRLQFSSQVGRINNFRRLTVLIISSLLINDAYHSDLDT